MGMEFISGLTGEFMLDSGIKEDNMEKVFLQLQVEKSTKEFGKKAKE